MKKNYKLVLGLALGLAFGTMMTQPTTTEAKVKTVKNANAKTMGKMIVTIQNKAYKSKKKVTVRFKFKSNKIARKTADKAYKEAAKIQYGKKAYCSGLTAVAAPSADAWNDSGILIKQPTVYEITINGKSKSFRKDYREAGYERKLLEDLVPLTKGKSQFDKAWITMAWLRTRAIYQCGRNQDSSNEALWKRRFHADCDDLAGTYEYYAHCAGVKKVGDVEYDDGDGGHMWNYIVVKGRMYFIDFQGTNRMQGLNEERISIQKAVSMMKNPKFIEMNWDRLYWLNKWYRENVDANAAGVMSCAKRWDSMTAKQKKAFKKWMEATPSWDMYQYTCDSFSKSHFEPLKVFCDHSNGDYTVKQSKKWQYDGYQKKCPYPKALY